jgi:hypothetical protein
MLKDEFLCLLANGDRPKIFEMAFGMGYDGQEFWGAVQFIADMLTLPFGG